ncbi:UDP-N-acetylglucosamine 2-epimerase (hydrolyzing) [Rummeliibacillus sp. TYF005]|uniref:UDP-N-acetylglucosamine 2-epimerase n=1 Tax=Rummeliibacillus sp. TYF005 TaxID=2058214 RepID=UPI000F546AD1|nr:UDP-N-acetylglucosamine 2-epimerase [Rummeliibacillus sp. TYF005]RPJ96824.1 UDP-N-acetylglucosamine 2-epimerase (hydrolyzing) [Rummeliibacillus sp. TYF005]
MNKKICIVTGTRAEYGLLKSLITQINQDVAFELQLIATGTHLSHEFGLTYKQIEQDGFIIDEKIEMLLSSDTPTAVVKSMGLATIDFSTAFQRLNPDLIIILGDRFEMLAVAQTALILQIPIAHIHGGENTFGAYDDAIRHSITKMATWHFVSTEEHRKRVIQLGEHPSRVFNVGAMGIEYIFNLELLSKQKLYEELQLDLTKPFFLITQHSETNGDVTAIEDLLNVLDEHDVNLVFTKANADNGGREINKKIKYFTEINNRAKLFDSLGQLKYLSAVKHAQLVIGNSSSGLIEVPYLKTPSVNIGDRQKGRSCPNSVVTTGITKDEIDKGIKKALEFKGPYEQIFGDGHATKKVMEILKCLDTFKIQKEFYDL